MNDEMIRYVTGEYDVEIVRRLCVPKGGLSRISGLERCTQIVSLSLPENQIESIGNGLDSLLLLQRLDLSQNLLRKFTGLARLEALAFLDARANLVEAKEEIDRLKANTSLVHLHLKRYDGTQKNPLCEHSDYDSFIRQTLPKLQVLDGERLTLRKHREKLDRLIQGIRPDPEFLTPLTPRNWLDELVSETDDDELLPERQMKLLREECEALT